MIVRRGSRVWWWIIRAFVYFKKLLKYFILCEVGIVKSWETGKRKIINESDTWGKWMEFGSKWLNYLWQGGIPSETWELLPNRIVCPGQWLEHQPMHIRVMSSIPNQGYFVVHCSTQGCLWEIANFPPSPFLPPPHLPSLFLSLPPFFLLPSFLPSLKNSGKNILKWGKKHTKDRVVLSEFVVIYEQVDEVG